MEDIGRQGLAVLAAFCLLLAPIAHGAKRAGAANTAPITLAIATPEARTLALAYSFADKLLAQFEGNENIHVQLLEGVSDRSQAIAIAERRGFQFVLVGTVSAKEKRQFMKKMINKATPTDKLDLKTEQKLRVGIQYELLATDSPEDVILKKKVAPPKKATQDAVGIVAGTVASAVRGAIEKAGTRGEDGLLPGYEPRLVVQTSHSTVVNDFAYSPDGARLATLGADGVIKLWNVRTRMELNTIVAPSTSGITFSPKGRRMAALSRQGVVRVFDADTGNLVRRFTTTKREIDESEAENYRLDGRPVGVAYSADGRLLAHGGVDGVSVWDVATGNLKREGEEKKGVASFALSPRGDLVAAQITERRIKIIDTETGKKRYVLAAKVGLVTSLAFSPDGTRLAVGSKNGSIYLYDTATGEPAGEPPIYSPCDKPYEEFGVLDRVSDYGEISVVEVARGGRDLAGDACVLNKEVEETKAEGQTAFYTTSIRSVTLSPDSRYLAYGRADGRVRVLDLSGESAEESFEISMRSDRSHLRKDDSALGGLMGVARRGLVSSDFWGTAPVKFSSTGRTLDTVVDRNTVARWLTASGERESSLAVSKRDLSFGSAIPIPMASVPVFGPDNRTLLTATITGGTRLWELHSGLPPRLVSKQQATLNTSPVSADARYLVATERDGEETAVVVRETESGKVAHRFVLDSTSWLFNLPVAVRANSTFSPDSRYLAIAGRDAEGRWLRIMSLVTGDELFFKRNARVLGFSPNSELFAFQHLPIGMRIINFSGKTKVTVIDTKTQETYFEKRVAPSELGLLARGAAFSADSRLMALPENDAISVWNMKSDKRLGERANEDDSLSDFVFRPGTDQLTITTRRGMLHWDVTSGKVVRSNQYTDFYGNLSYSSDGALLALGGAENRIRLFDVDRDLEVGSLVVPNDSDWLTVTPEGRFDAQWLEDIEEVHWVLSDEPDRTHPLELFMREYYEPQLLTMLVQADELSDIPPLHTRNRALPDVEITKVSPRGDDRVAVTVRVREGVSEAQVDGDGSALRSGGASLRLFRDNRLVGRYPEDLGDLTFTGGVAEHTFDVALPVASQVTWSAYAMNSQNIKSETARFEYTTERPAGASTKPNAYVISIGVDASEQRQYSLRHAGNDARALSASLTRTLNGTGNFAAVVPVTLISSEGGEQHATKARMRAVLEVLAGQQPASRLAVVPGSERLRRSQPDDLVLITFSGHGYTDKGDGRFFLFPSDMGEDPATTHAELLSRAVSSDELASWLTNVDADITMVVDSCHSQAAIGEDFKAGPLGSRGLGQLSYDKGMRVLAGAQSNEIAMESNELSHGLLSYALARDGIDNRAADYSPADGRIVAREWLRYAVRRVPELRREMDGSEGARDVLLAGRPTEPSAQTPVVFEFSRSVDGPLLEREASR
ncbi:MAG: PQQ-binding-like beta-propeller repeat protein [Pseudomonadota bacterium]